VTKGRKTALVALTIVLVGGAAFVVWKLVYRPEPVYQGKRLGAWAQQFGSNNWSVNPASREAESAIRQMGAQGIPFLLDRMRAEESGAMRKLREILPQRWHDSLRLKDRSGETRRIGSWGIAALGTNAPPDLVPKLIAIATHHPDEDGRYIAVFALRTLGPRAEPAIPFFVRCLTNSYNIIRDEAAMGLGSVGRQPGIAVPALMQYLEFARTTPSSFEAVNAIESLGKFGTNARAAAPLLLSFLNHSRVEVRVTVTNCLPWIDEEAAARAQVGRR
jgi:hypothetical protein